MGKQNKANQKLRISQIDLERIIGLKTKKNKKKPEERKREEQTNKNLGQYRQTDINILLFKVFYFYVNKYC
jgi:hypothetical protein